MLDAQAIEHVHLPMQTQHTSTSQYIGKVWPTPHRAGTVYTAVNPLILLAAGTE